MPGSSNGGERPLRPIPVSRSLPAIAGGYDWLDEIPDVTVCGITLDSRSVLPGDLYCALPGANTHGARFAAEAVSRGCVAILTDPVGRDLILAEFPTCPVLVCDDPRSRLGYVSSAVYGHPSRSLRIIGITGTDGKTTTAMLAEAGLREAGFATGLIGTIATRIGDDHLKAVRTTPEAPDLHATLAVMVERGVQAVAMEVSSHAIALGRVSGVRFDVAVFTNLGHDHLDFHIDQEEYFAVKARLFSDEFTDRAIICIDDEWGERLAESAAIPVESYSVAPAGSPRKSADWVVADLAIVDVGWQFQISGPRGVSVAGCRLPGLFNVRNALAAVAASSAIGADLQLASRGVAECMAVPGRMEPVEAASGLAVLVDYAHTPDAVARALGVGQELASHRGGRLLVVVGCGGNRDRGKRPLMGEVAARLADVVVITDDNPRAEDPAQIRREMMTGVARVPAELRAEVREIAGREDALREVVRMASRDDVILALGKGHETTQEINGEFHPLDDRLMLARVLAEST